MTAEVCVMNTIGIALAADSAVSIGGNDSGKIYNFANKLFALSKSSPVGIMIYGNADFMDVPWETVIKTYRKEYRNIQFDTLEEYASAFIEFVKTNPYFSNEDTELRSILSISELFIKDIIDNDLAELIIESRENDYEVDYVQKFEDFVDERTDELSKIETLIKDPTLFNRFKNDYTKYINEFLNDNLFFDFNEVILKKTTRCVYLLIIKDTFQYQNHSGIVIAGFGEKDFFPKLTEHSIGGTFYGNLKISEEEKIIISNKFNHARAAIIPFAQKEMVYTFLNGIDENILKFMPYTTMYTLNNYFDDVILPNLDKTLSEDQVDAIKIDYIGKSLQEISLSINDFIYNTSTEPVLKILPTFPKEELASIAETLVNLTSFKRKVSQETETVGGPIDVAIITKGDGFVWVKRKLYFDKNLNHDYFNNRNKY